MPKIHFADAVEGVVLVRAMTMTMARVRRTRRDMRMGPGKGMENGWEGERQGD